MCVVAICLLICPVLYSGLSIRVSRDVASPATFMAAFTIVSDKWSTLGLGIVGHTFRASGF